jgi:hypothetical protein
MQPIGKRAAGWRLLLESAPAATFTAASMFGPLRVIPDGAQRGNAGRRPSQLSPRLRRVPWRLPLRQRRYEGTNATGEWHRSRSKRCQKEILYGGRTAVNPGLFRARLHEPAVFRCRRLTNQVNRLPTSSSIATCRYRIGVASSSQLANTTVRRSSETSRSGKDPDVRDHRLRRSVLSDRARRAAALLTPGPG